MIKNKRCSHGNEVKSYQELDRVTGEFILQQFVLKSDHLQVQTRLAKAESPPSNRARLNWPMLRQLMKKQNRLQHKPIQWRRSCQMLERLRLTMENVSQVTSVSL